MRFLHTSDLHIGKRLKDQSLLAEQRFFLSQLLDLVKERDVDAVLIAGDIYDKSVPSGEAISMFDDFLTDMNACGTDVFLIAGNHDSAERIDFASRILSRNRVHISGSDLRMVTLTDAYGEICIWLMPYMRSVNASAALEAAAVDVRKRNVILSHQFVVGEDAVPEKAGSETLSIGGVDVVSAAAYKAFDYVALGHIHRSQTAGSPVIRYSGSPYRYDFGECNQEKGIWLVEIAAKGSITSEFVPLIPQRDLYRIECPLAELAAQIAPRDAYIELTLTDAEPVVDAIYKARNIYPNTLNLIPKHRYSSRETTHVLTSKDIAMKSPFELFAVFFEDINGAPLSEAQREYLQEVIAGGAADETANA